MAGRLENSGKRDEAQLHASLHQALALRVGARSRGFRGILVEAAGGPGRERDVERLYALLVLAAVYTGREYMNTASGRDGSSSSRFLTPEGGSDESLRTRW